MNRKKKINEALKKHQKRKNAKLHRSNKPRYISKADRAKYEEAAQLAGMTVEQYMDTLVSAATTETADDVEATDTESAQ
ncbi:DUF2986 domain-containing protein [Photobacterium nomapromontoriensis]|uniref:DUF2986 domain-containing protein n=1 Tax=Photobacterium nomapromontoriensis TaxID=2910237 RepID=UPI003D148C07